MGRRRRTGALGQRVEDEQVEEVRRRQWPRRLRLALAVLLALLVVALLALWLMRVRIAGDLIDRELADRGVQANYDVKRIGFGTQIFDQLMVEQSVRPALEQALSQAGPVAAGVDRGVSHKRGLSRAMRLGKPAIL